MADPKDARAVARKILRCSARVIVSETLAHKARTQDISMAGISLMLDEPLPLGQTVTVVFDAPINGRIVKIQVTAKAMYCSCVGTSGFRAGMHFGKLPEDVAKLIRQLLQ